MDDRQFANMQDNGQMQNQKGQAVTDTRDKAALQKSVEAPPVTERQRDFWKAEADHYAQLWRKEQAESRSWRSWSIWWFGWALFCVAAFWYEVWRHANHG